MTKNFPLYEIRKYVKITTEGNLRIIQTARNKYVLDVLNTEEPLYSKRRLLMLSMGLPYKIYPLTKRFDNLAQLVNGARGKMFINSLGRLVQWDKKVSRRIITRRIVKYWETEGGYILVASETGLQYFVSASEYNLEPYIELLCSNNTEIFLRVLDREDLSRSRKKI